jgi:hypothetical protein
MEIRYANDKIISNIYIELNKDNDGTTQIIDREIIEDVLKNGQSLFLKEKIKEGAFEEVDFKYVGKFKARHSIIQKTSMRLKPKNKKYE